MSEKLKRTLKLRRGLSLLLLQLLNAMQDTGSPELFEEPLTFSTYKNELYNQKKPKRTTSERRIQRGRPLNNAESKEDDLERGGGPQ
jgi:hypothetical protein